MTASPSQRGGDPARLEGTPSDDLPVVLGTGTADVRFAFVSLSAREPHGRDADYIEWHSLDHRPEQYRLAGLRNSLRLVSTPECRAARAAQEAPFDGVDHVMTYMFAGADALPGFGVLGGELDRAGRMPLRLPSVGYLTADFVGKIAAPRAVAGADVIPWRPARGVYLLVEDGHASPAPLVNVPGVSGIWWFDGAAAPEPYTSDHRGRRISYLYLDGDPVATAAAIAPRLTERWATGDATGVFAAPFFAIAPFEWGRHLPA